jgi:hypothetical protein
VDQLWFVQQGMERRRKAAAAALEQQQQQQQQEQQQAAREEQQRPAEGGADGAAAAAPPPLRPPAAWARAAALQAAQLSAGLAALILLPAALCDGGLAPGSRAWTLFLTYFLFFAGSVRRVLLYGPLARPARDAQRRSPAALAALAAFVLVAVPAIHWLPLRRFLLAAAALPPDAAAAAGPSLYDFLGTALIAAGTVLNWAAAAALGSAYDRVVAPGALVTSGPYALVQASAPPAGRPGRAGAWYAAWERRRVSNGVEIGGVL